LFYSFDSSEAKEIPTTQFDVNRSLAAKELYEAMNELPRAQREAISLFEISGFSIKEVAEIQGTNENTVKTRLRRGRDKLSELLEVQKPNLLTIKEVKTKGVLKESIL
jgi:RNA polymerase sigma factor (sigma-70 family)